MTISFQKYILGDAPRCCGAPMKRAPKVTVLREPPTPLRLMGHTRSVCGRIGVTPTDMEGNQRRARLALTRVRPPSDLYRLMKSDGKE